MENDVFETNDQSLNVTFRIVYKFKLFGFFHFQIFKWLRQFNLAETFENNHKKPYFLDFLVVVEYAFLFCGKWK